MPRLGILFLICFFTATFSTHSFSGTYSTERQEKDRWQSSYESKLRKHIGNTYWILPNQNAVSRAVFYSSPTYPHGNFYVDEKESFKIIDLINNGHLNYLYKIQFESGKIGYISESEFNIHKHSHASSKESARYSELICEQDPSIVATKESTKRKQVAEKNRKVDEEKKARGGVTLGMTKDQVLNSSWGKPQRVHKTTVQGLKREQWVYGDSNYLYFDNGVLSGIQN